MPKKLVPNPDYGETFIEKDGERLVLDPAPVGVLEDLKLWFQEHPETLEMIKGEIG